LVTFASALLLVVSFNALPIPVAAQRWTLPDSLQQQVDEVFSFVDVDEPGCAMGILQDGMMAYGRGYGLANLDWGIPLSTSSVLDIGSVSKQFTATAVALLDMDGVLSLDDDIRRWIPEMPDYGNTITIRHLLNHTSGIRDYLTLMGLTGFDWANVFDEEDGVEVIARQKALNFEPGAEYLYSNSGYLLLANIVRRSTGRSLREFLEERVFDPLGMANTSIWDDNTEVLHERATGYTPGRGGWEIDHAWNFQMGGDGQVITSVEDLLKWDQNFYTPRVGGQGLLDRLHTRGILNSGDTIRYALGLTLDEHRGLQRVQHTGSWAGFRAVLARYPSHRTSVVVLCNRGDAGPSAYANRIAELVLADDLAPLPAEERGARGTGADPTEPVELSEDQLIQWVGLYRAPDQPDYMRVGAVGGALTIGAGDTSYALRPVSEDHFVIEGPGVDIWFSAEADRVSLRIGSVDGEVFRRVEEFQPSLGEMRELEGRYFSEELGMTIEVRLDGDRLLLHRRGREPVAMTPGTHGEFEVAGLGVTFQRRSGAISGARVYAGRVTGLVFERVEGVPNEPNGPRPSGVGLQLEVG
jgi:CubicO group peptidase (beta-lactamase class C family)